MTYFNRDDCLIEIDTETAWSPMPEPILMMCEKYAPHAKITYTAQEPGCGYYVSNDPDVVGRYLMEIWETNELPESLKDVGYEYLEKDELKEILEEALNCKKGLPFLISNMQKQYDTVFINYMEYANIEDIY